MRGSTLVVHGEPGIGKTALLDAAEQAAVGMRVLRTRGVDLDSEIPFGGLFDLFRPIFDVFDQVPPAQRAALKGALGLGPPVSADRFAISTGTLAVLSAASDRKPILVIVDDAQWLDDASMEGLLFASRRLRLDSVAFLFAVRDNERGTRLSGEFDGLWLRALREHEVAQLAAGIHDEPLAPQVSKFLVTATGGNPLTIIETIRALSDAQLSGRKQLPSTLPLGVSAVEIFRRRISRLDAEPAKILGLIAVDSTGDSAVLRRAAAHRGLAYRPPLEKLEAASLVKIEFGRPTLTHPLVRAALEGTIEPAELRASHRALAVVLADRPDPTACAWHLAAAATEPDESVAAALERAAEVAGGRSAYGAAALAFERSAGLSVSDEARAERLLRAAEAARYAGRADQGQRLLEQAQSYSATAPTMSLVECEKARGELYFGRALNARQLFENAAARVRDESPVQSALILAQAACAAVLTDDPVMAAKLAYQAKERVELDDGEPVVELALGYALLHQGDVARSLSVLRAAGELTWRRRDDIDPDCLPFAVLALTWVGDFDQARELINRLLPKARSESAFGYLCFLLYSASYLEARTGHLISAYALASEGVTVAETTSTTLWRYLSLCCLAFIEAAQGREEECREHAAIALDIARQQEFAYPATIQDALGLLELSLGHPDQAIVHLEPVNVRPGSTEPTLGRPTGPDLIESYIRSGRELPESIITQLKLVSDDDRFPAAAAAADRCLGLAAPETDLERHFERSLHLQSKVSNPFALARTEFCYGERLRRAGRRRQARAHLLAAHALFVELGAMVWAARVNDELRAAGGAVRGNTTQGVATLTPQELQVAITVAKGATNREAGAELYVSPKTIEFHLSQIYRKLGIRSRSELTAQMTKVQPRIPDADSTAGE